MKKHTDTFSTYQSPFSWRYGSQQMRVLFSEHHKYEIWRSIWVALASAERQAGLITERELKDIVSHAGDIHIDRILELEKETKHDVVAALKEFAERCPIGGGKIHFGATSMDIVDNAEMVRIQEGLTIVVAKLNNLLRAFSTKMETMADVVCMGYTHLQPAEPTTVGYRLAFYAQDLLTDAQHLSFVAQTIQAKGMKGAVGTRASYSEILRGTDMTPEMLDRLVMATIGLRAADITSQVYSRKYDYLVASVLAGIASSCAKFASDLRILQSPLFGEWSEPFGKKQVGSSAMPFKKNPINSEKICSLARYSNQLPALLLENATLSYLERTLDDSANRRITIPEAFLAVDEILDTTERLVTGMVFHTKRIAFNLNQFGPFAASEPLLIALVKKGVDRQQMHEVLRDIALHAWEEVQNGMENRMGDLLQNAPAIRKYLTEKEIMTILTTTRHIGDAPQRVTQLIKKIRAHTSKTSL